MSKCILFIDGENFLYKIEDVLNQESKDKSIINTANVDFDKLFESPLQGLKPLKKIFYAAKLHEYPATKKKS